MLSPNILFWTVTVSYALFGFSPTAYGCVTVFIKDYEKRAKAQDICLGVMLASALILGLSAIISYNQPNKNSDSKDADKTAQVQKLRTAINNHTTANWNNFAQKVK